MRQLIENEFLISVESWDNQKKRLTIFVNITSPTKSFINVKSIWFVLFADARMALYLLLTQWTLNVWRKPKWN